MQSIQNFSLDTESGTIKKATDLLKKTRMGKPEHEKLNKAIYDWYEQYKAIVATVSGLKIHKVASHMKLSKLISKEEQAGCIGKCTTKTTEKCGGENHSVGVDSIAPFKAKLKQLKKDSNLMTPSFIMLTRLPLMEGITNRYTDIKAGIKLPLN